MRLRDAIYQAEQQGGNLNKTNLKGVGERVQLAALIMAGIAEQDQHGNLSLTLRGHTDQLIKHNKESNT